MTTVTAIGNRLAPPRFLIWVAVTVAATLAVSLGLDVGWARAVMSGFDIGAAVFLLSLIPLLRNDTPENMVRHANANDANRHALLAIAGAVVSVILLAVSHELSAAGRPDAVLVLMTLALAWLFANTVYALHYAHVYYGGDKHGGLGFAGDDAPDYGDFIYFSFILGMAFQTSDTTVETSHLRRLVLIHSLAAFAFNIGVLAFSINVLGSGSGG
jgi:uncharacterized membrane protein